MKYKIYLNTLVIFLVFAGLTFFALTASAATSNSVTTKVGNPSGSAPVAPSSPSPSLPPVSGGETSSASNCPIPGGTLTCGTRNTPVNGCGHCGVGYAPYMHLCSYSGTSSAIDIQGSDFQEVYLPSIDGHDILWTFSGEAAGSPAIHIFTGVDTVTKDTYLIQFHHTHPGSGNTGTHRSGERAANICGNGCNQGHVHVQLAKDNDWVDATQFLCK